jgi:hypothetical protein
VPCARLCKEARRPADCVWLYSELVGLMLFDASRKPAETISARAWELFQERRLRIADFMHNARMALDVPSTDKCKDVRKAAVTGGRRS